MGSRVFGRALRVGVITPPANTAVEAELPALLPPGAQCYATRLPVVRGPLLGRLEAYNSSLSTSAGSFGGMDLDVLYLACTGSSYLMGGPEEEVLGQRMQAGGGTRVVLTAAQAVRWDLQRLRASHISVVSPYPDELTDLAVKLWKAWGFEVDQVTRMACGSIYDTSAAEVLEAALRSRPAAGGVVLLSGTGLPTLETLQRLRTEHEIEATSSTLAAGRWLTNFAQGYNG